MLLCCLTVSMFLFPMRNQENPVLNIAYKVVWPISNMQLLFSLRHSIETLILMQIFISLDLAFFWSAEFSAKAAKVAKIYATA
jgi:hypothetical protein